MDVFATNLTPLLVKFYRLIGPVSICFRNNLSELKEVKYKFYQTFTRPDRKN